MMILNILVGFIIPWVFGIILYFKDKKIVLIIAPFASMLAYTVDECFHLEFWSLAPFNINDDYTSLSVQLGLFSILGCYMIYYITKNMINAYFIIMFFTVITTILEYLGVLFNVVSYRNGWNIGWTFLSYLIPYLLVYWFYIKMRDLKVF
ncbi:MAG: CBO0543 family protein [Clostridium sp.]|uniref:CBO0543 family protein n=1 Tax=Clostridium sp. TaxID=1506 RepID=UPI003D6D51CE